MYGDSFATFYRASQIRIFSALDNALSQKAEDTLTEFAAVKNAEVQLQTSLGNRQGQLGINLIGAFAESQNLGIGWQVRAFGGQNDTKGMNAGIFYRRVQNDLLYGINAFADYEDGDNGSFLRYSIGGELQNRYGALVASYYTPITGDKHTGEQVAFSREGYDFNLRLNIPRLDFLNARVDYYHYHGKYNVKEDKGLRYGAEAHLFPGLRVALLYDDDGDELGGDISYTHTIGEVQQSQTANEQWTPDLFAAVSREHSQRIIKATIASADGMTSPPEPQAPDLLPNIVEVELGTTARIGAINIDAGYFSGTPTINAISPPMGFAITGNDLIWQPDMLDTHTLGIVVSDTPPSASATLSITIASYQVEASVLFTTIVNSPVGRLIATTSYHVLVTLPPAATLRPRVLTIMRDLGSYFFSRTNTPGGFYRDIDSGLTRGVYRFLNTGLSSYTITVVQGSEISMRVSEQEGARITLIGQADIPFMDMPDFSPPSFPHMAKLALAKNARNAIPIPPHFTFMRQKGFAAKPPPLIF